MSTFRAMFFLLVATSPAMARQAPPPITIKNLALPVNVFGGDGQVVAFGVTEGWHGGLDLNGDGDSFDQVLFVADSVTATVSNLGIAVQNSLLVNGTSVIFLVSEMQQGGDLNGDGDNFDPQVIHRYDHLAGTVQNTGRAGWIAGVDGTRVSMLVSEAFQSQDLNGDGDLFDNVAEVFEGSSGTAINLGLAASQMVLDGDVLGIGMGEVQQGSTDLNLDGDTLDIILHLVHLPTGILISTGLAMPKYPVMTAAQGRFVLRVSEASSGPAGTDFNGDGDAQDDVLHVVDLGAGAIRNLALALSGTVFRQDGGRAAVLVSEADQGADLNGDGDRSDSVAHYIDLTTGATTPLAATPVAPILSPGGRVALTVSEADQGGVDRNGDGDAVDQVAHVFDPGTGMVSNLALAVANATLSGLSLSDQLLAITVTEKGQGQSDLNGDGDADDFIPHVHRFATGDTRLTGVATSFASAIGDRVAFSVSESGQGGQDLNGDGDGVDSVAHVFDGVSHTTANLGLTGIPVPFTTTTAWVVVSESQSGADLNGDGDTLESVGHLVANLPGACGAIAGYGSGCAGTAGLEPHLSVNGCLAAGQKLRFGVSSALPGGQAWVAIGLTPAAAPLPAGCTLHLGTIVPFLVGPLPVTSFGGASLAADTPPLPSGLVLYLQGFVVSAGGAFGTSAAVSVQAP